MRKSLLPLLCLAVSLPASSFAADPAKAPQVTEQEQSVPGEDIFGFTSPTDVGNVGDMGLALENDGRFGKRDGRYRVLTQKLEASRTFAPNWSYALSLFGDWHNSKSVSVVGTDFSNGYKFDGISTEVRHRILERSANQPFAITLALEPRWGRIDGLSGLTATSFSAEAKFQIDAPIAERLFWGANLNFSTARQRDTDVRTNWSVSSGSTVSTAIAYAIEEDKLFVGTEARWLHSYERAFFGSVGGNALFVGPTLAWKASDKLTVNLAVLPQVTGKAKGVAGRLDLDNSEKANIRLKVVASF